MDLALFQMPKSYLVMLLILLLTVFLCTSATRHKVNEQSNRVTNDFYCGDQLFNMYQLICYHQTRRRRSLNNPIMKDNEARKFVRHRSKRSSTNIVEECCTESCKHEEIREYCMY